MKLTAQKAVTYCTNNRQRMKVTGAFWNLEPARKVAGARAAYLSDRWNELASRRSHLFRAA